MAEKEYSVYFPVYAEYAVRVTIDPDDYSDTEEMIDSIIDAAYEGLPGSICAQCTGWGRDWNLDLDSSAAEAHYIDDEDSKTIWGDPNKKLGW